MTHGRFRMAFARDMMVLRNTKALPLDLLFNIRAVLERLVLHMAKVFPQLKNGLRLSRYKI